MAYAVMNDWRILLGDLGVTSLGDNEVFVAVLGEAGCLKLPDRVEVCRTRDSQRTGGNYFTDGIKVSGTCDRQSAGGEHFTGRVKGGAAGDTQRTAGDYVIDDSRREQRVTEYLALGPSAA